MELRHLQALVAVSERSSFSAAADALNTVQSNISSHVARLERELGCILFDRANGRLTAEGETVVSRAYRILGEVEALSADIGAMREELAGTVKAGMIGTTARWLVPTLLSELLLKHPKIQLVVTDGTTTSLVPLLESSRLDLALVTAPVPGRDCSFEPFFEEGIVLVVPAADDPVAGRARIRINELSGFSMLLPAPGTVFRNELDSALRPAGAKLRRPLAELDGVRLIASLAFEGHGPALLPASAIPVHLRDQFRLVTVDGLPNRRVGLAMRVRGMPSAPARAVIDTLRRIAARTEGLPAGVHPVVPEVVARAEFSVRALGVPNG